MIRQKTDWKLLLQIFLTFLKIGPLTFGGGYAMIPLIEREVVEGRKWMLSKDITDIFVIAQSIPGAIAINSAILIGYRKAGYLGSIIAMIGVLLPTFCIVVLLSYVYMQIQDNPKVEAAFMSIRATIVALIIYAAYKIGKTAIVDKTTLSLVFLTVIVMYFAHIHPVIIIIAGGLAGIVIVFIRGKLGLETKLTNEDIQMKYKYKDKDYFMGGGI
jgi:chromate transporter